MNVKTKFDSDKFITLLNTVSPCVIRTEADNERMLNEIWKLMKKGEDNLTPEESVLFGYLTGIVEEFESKHYQIEDAPPDAILRNLMEERGIRQRDLIIVFGSRGLASEVVNGKRSISKSHAKKLANFFNVSPELFLYGVESQIGTTGTSEFDFADIEMEIESYISLPSKEMGSHQITPRRASGEKVKDIIGYEAELIAA